MKRKLFILIYTTCIVLAVVLLNVVVTTIKRSPAIAPSAEEEADLSLGQFTERPNSTLVKEKNGFSHFILMYLFQRTEALAEGCSLRFSIAPKNKAVEPSGEIEYTITVSNQGRETCENTSFSLYYSDRESFVRSTPEPSASDYYWVVGNLGSKDIFTVDLVTKNTLRNSEEMISEGCVTADNASDVCSQNIIFARTGASRSSLLSNRLTISQIFGSIWGSRFKERDFGIWVWDSPIQMNPSYAGEVISVSKQNGFNVIYITIDDYVALTQIRDDKERTSKKEEYMKALSVFIQGAKSAGISVDVVGGAKDWAIEGNRWKGYALIDFVKEYNKIYPTNPIRGLQYDVEPYLLSEYNSDKKKVLKEFVEFVDEAAKRMTDSSARLSIVIPHFYDQERKWTPSFSYKGEDAHTFTHLLKVLEQKENTSIIIMSYRNFFEGDNGTKTISEAEVREATEGGYKTNIIIAQETGNVAPEYVTFYDYPKVSLFDALTEIQTYFKQYENFGGTAVHYFDPFLKLD